MSEPLTLDTLTLATVTAGYGGGADPQSEPTLISRVIPAKKLPHTAVPDKYVQDEFFGHQPAARDSLPNPQPLLENLTTCVIEILAGARDLNQIARWVTDEVYRNLLKRVVISARARRAKGQTVTRPVFSIGSTSVCEPRDGVVEAVVIVRGRARTRAVALRLEGLDHRWRATSINVL